MYRRSDTIGRMNWAEIVRQLEGTGLKQVEIAEACGCKQPTIAELKSRRRGKRVTYDIGTKLVDLWRVKCAQGSRQAVPPSGNS